MKPDAADAVETPEAADAAETPEAAEDGRLNSRALERLELILGLALAVATLLTQWRATPLVLGLAIFIYLGGFRRRWALGAIAAITGCAVSGLLLFGPWAPAEDQTVVTAPAADPMMEERLEVLEADINQKFEQLLQLEDLDEVDRYLAETRIAITRWLNAKRQAVGSHDVGYLPSLELETQRHTELMVTESSIFHGPLGDGIFNSTDFYCCAGENVGVGSTWIPVLEAMIESPGHKANITSTNYDYVGIGLKSNADRTALFVTLRFMGLA